MTLYEFSLQFPPAVCDVVAHAGFLLRPRIRCARTAWRRLAGAGIQPHDIPGAAHHDTDSDRHDEVLQCDSSLAPASAGAETGTDTHCWRSKAGAAGSVASGLGRRHTPAPSAWNSAIVSDKRAACACTRV